MKWTEHTLKCLAVYFDAIENGEKNFEVRKDDRGYQKGDILILQRCYDPNHYAKYLFGRSYEVEHDSQGEPRFTLRRRISYILTGGQFGIEPGYIVMALEGVDEQTASGVPSADNALLLEPGGVD